MMDSREAYMVRPVSRGVRNVNVVNVNVNVNVNIY